MIRKHLLAMAVLLFAAVSVSAKQAVVGSVLSSQGATVHGANLKAGSTIFSGDTIEVGPKGSAVIALPNGGQVQVSADSQVSLSKTADSIELSINKGHASANGQVSVVNHTSPDSSKDKGYSSGDDHKKDKGDGDDDDDDNCEVSPHHHKKDKGKKGYDDSHDHCHDH